MHFLGWPGIVWTYIFVHRAGLPEHMDREDAQDVLSNKMQRVCNLGSFEGQALWFGEFCEESTGAHSCEYA